MLSHKLIKATPTPHSETKVEMLIIFQKHSECDLVSTDCSHPLPTLNLKYETHTHTHTHTHTQSAPIWKKRLELR